MYPKAERKEGLLRHSPKDNIFDRQKAERKMDEWTRRRVIASLEHQETTYSERDRQKAERKKKSHGILSLKGRERYSSKAS